MAFSGRRWSIVQELVKGDRSPTQLAAVLRLSLQGVYHHLKQMESEGLVHRAETSHDGSTRPFTVYTLAGGFCQVTEALPGEARQYTLTATELVKVHLRIWSIPQQEYHYYLEALWWELQPFIERIEGIVLYGSVARGDARQGSDIDILLLTADKGLEKRFGARLVGPKETAKLVSSQFFTTEDFSLSLRAGSQFARSVMSEAIIVYDPRGVFAGMRRDTAGKAGERVPRGSGADASGRRGAV
ncbi:helix-turn-helix domain-containing protein [Candidatus Woesearchaeota archaeon]|nr:helix-turn-helix domain-containing protein [Candidatus Woesearchaeota archaeon]